MNGTYDGSLAAGLCLFSILALPSGAAADALLREPVRLIFDTDVGNDIDDALALAVIHALASRGECQLLAVTITKDNSYSAPFVDLVNTFYGRGNIPIGMVRRGVTPKDSRYTRGPVLATEDGRQRYPHALLDGRDAPEAVALLRKVLAGQPDGSVVVVQVGFSTNLARLLDSQPDENSPLDGLALAGRKVRLLSAMAGSFTAELAAKRFKEFNVVTDLPSARKLFSQWPTPIVVSGWEIGAAIRYPARSIQQDFGYARHHPIREAYELYAKMPYDRPAWDLTSVLYAVRPDRGYFDVSAPGRVIAEADGVTRFQDESGGPHRYLTVNAQQVIRVVEALEILCSQPPEKR